MSLRPKTLLASLALAGLAGVAQADAIKVDVYNGYVDIVQSSTYAGDAALWSVTNTTVPADSFLAYCIELIQAEPPRLLRRLNTLRGLSHEQVEQVLA
ncbi:hypothetical protein [Pseudorhodoferax sp.]|uniref:hypothetical protein n=1 Tax=Pseudorhodoferax sp. TaxID=1993553 RepID=UPI002DD684A7|nr:hypothetical protein [Pseudorhodoferax sp.]